MTLQRATLATLLLMAIPWPAGAQIGSGAPIVVLPFENTAAEVPRGWIREGAALLLTDALGASGEVTVDRDERLRAFDRLQLPATASLSRASVIKVGQAVGAVAVVVGSFEVSASELTARARVIRLDTGRLLPEVSAKGPASDLFGVFSRLARQLTGNDSAPPTPADRGPSSPRAFELYVRGLIADTPALQAAFLEQALTAAPAYDLARVSLWRVHTEAADHQRAFATISRMSSESRLAREARFLAALSLINLKRFDEAHQSLRDLENEAPAAAVANAIGVIELRRSATPQPGRATYYFSQATDVDPDDGDLFFNLGYAYWLERDARAAIYWLREAVRRDPGDGDAHFILGTALHQTGATAEATRERELALRLSSTYTAWDARAAGGGDAVPRGLERLHDQLEHPPAGVDTLMTTAGQRDQDSLAQFHLDAGRRAFEREADREALQALRRALYLSPYLAEAHVLLGRLHLRGGRVDEAIEALKIALWSDETAATHVVLAEAHWQAHDAAAARAEIDRALALDPSSADAQRLKTKFAGAPW